MSNRALSHSLFLWPPPSDVCFLKRSVQAAAPERLRESNWLFEMFGRQLWLGILWDVVTVFGVVLKVQLNDGLGNIHILHK